MSEIFDSSLEMKSGQAEAVKNIYDVYVGKSGFIWLVANNVENKADFIYQQGTKSSDGFGGAELEFAIKHGGSIRLKGAWKTGAKNLLSDTGVDVTQCYRGLIVLSRTKNVSKNPYAYRYEDVVLNTGWSIGPFSWDLAPKMAQDKANELGCRIYYTAITEGGASSHHKEPEQANE